MPDQNKASRVTDLRDTASLMTARVDPNATTATLSITGVDPSNWFGPLNPIRPTAPPDVGGRQFDYPTGVNVRYTPRGEQEGLSFYQLRAVADSLDLLRLVIETRKDQIESYEWEILPREKDDDSPQTKAQMLQASLFFEKPAPDYDWPGWLRALLEDLFVIDALALYPRYTRGGKLFGVELVDGGTIKRVLDYSGRTPMPPDPAYQQILKGVPAATFSTEELIYWMRNPRTNRIYGYSPTEQVIMTVNIALRKVTWQMNYFSEGNIPEAICGVPENWTARQIQEFQMYWDSVMEGNLAIRRKMKFVPVDPSKMRETREVDLKDMYDEWLARIICFAFSIPAQPFVREMNRATAETAKEQAREEGLTPLLGWLSRKFTTLITDVLQLDRVRFSWRMRDAIDAETQSRIHASYLDRKVLTVDEVREDLGKRPLTPEQTEALQPPVAAKPAPATEEPELEEEEEEEDESAKSLTRTSLAKAAPKSEYAKYIERKTKVVSKVIAAFFEEEAEKLSSEVARKRDVDGISFERWEGLADVLQDIIKSTFERAGRDSLLGVTKADDAFSLVNEEAVVFAKKRAAMLVGTGKDAEMSITETTRKRLRSLVTKAVAEGWSSSELRSAIQQDTSFSLVRAETIARTELATAHIQGNLAGWRASGVVVGKQSIMADEHEHEDECDFNASVGTIDLDKDFPSGHSGPPYHPNCLCDLVPVLEDE